MRKPMLALILLLVVFASSVTLFAQEGLIIREIVVVGNTRTSERVIRGQLPFKEGDVWHDGFQEWTIRRFTTLNIFSYEPMRVTAKAVSESECRVMVRIGDPGILYKDAAEFAFTTGVGLIYRQFTSTIFNPIGTGQNLNLNIVWGHNYSYGGSVTSPLGLGPGIIALGG